MIWCSDLISRVPSVEISRVISDSFASVITTADILIRPFIANSTPFHLMQPTTIDDVCSQLLYL